MNLNQLLAELSQKGIKLSVEGEQLRIRAPKGALTRSLRNHIIELKPELLSFLSSSSPKPHASSSPKPHASSFPLSHNQRALWFLYKLAPQSVAYNTGFAIRIRSVVDVAALRAAFELILERHGVLRATFPLREGEPVQVVHARQELCFELLDAQGCSDDELIGQVQDLYERPFVLEDGPLMRVSFFTRSPKDHVLLLSIHHIVFDAWSFGVLLKELGTLYPALSGAPGILPLSGQLLPPLATHYVDFVRWQDEMLGSAEGERLWAYWREQLGGALPVLNLPTDYPRPPVQTTHGSSYYLALPDELARRVKALAHAHGATRFMTLLAAFQVLLHRYTGQAEILVGSPSTGRSKAEFAPLVGYFINRLILRANLSENPTFTAFLSQVRQTVLEAMAHQDYPFPVLVEQLQPQRDASRTPLFQAAFAVHNTQQFGEMGAFLAGQSEESLQWGGLEVEPFPLSAEQGQFDLILQIVLRQTALSAIFKYNTDLFDEATIERMATHFQVLLTAMVDNPLTRVANLPLLTAEERHQLLIGWNQSEQRFPLEKPFHELFEAQVRKTPEAVAAYFEGQEVTYEMLNRRANRLAHLLVAQGIEPEKLVPLLARRSIDFLTAILAIFKAGGAYLPLDPFHPPHRIAQVLHKSEANDALPSEANDALPSEANDALPSEANDALPSEANDALPSEANDALPSESSLVLVGQAFEAVLVEALEHLPVKRRVPYLVLEEALEAPYSEENLPLRSTADELAYVIFTSGSTGLPKGAMVEQKGMVNHIYAKILDLGLRGEDNIAQNAPQSFDISVWQFLAGLLVGARVHIFNDELSRDPMRLLSEVGEHQITIFELVPALMRMMLAGKIRPDLSKLRWLIPTGEALSPVLARQWLADYPTIPMLNAYGPTECSDDVTHYPIYEPPAAHVMNMPIGRPVANMRIYLLDKLLKPVPIGVVGELYVGGIGVGRGYLNDPERTAKAFIADHFSADESTRLYKTGDLARYLLDGNIEFLGRVDYQVKIRGFRIELGEIESVLAQAPFVQEVVVVAREDSTGEKQLVAYIVPKTLPPTPSLAPSLIAQWRAHLQEKLPSYMVPTAFVLLNALPLTPNGKVNRQALPVPGADSYVQEAYVAPENPLEQWLVKLWGEVLGLKRIGVTDNFFEIGGDSIKVAILVNKLQEQLGEVLHIVALFDAPTVRKLASYLKQNYASAVRAIVDVTVQPTTSAPTAGAVATAITAKEVAQLRQLSPFLPAFPASTLKNKAAIFILSPPRSGSTLLRVLLGGHPQLFAPPELELLSFNTLQERKAAFTGRNSFWLEGLTRAIMQLKGGSAAEAQLLMSQLEAQGLTSKQMYRLLQEWLGCRVLVDKTPSYALDLATLKRAEADFEKPLYIYLQRHPLASIHSFEKVRLDEVFFRHKHPFPRRVLAELLWLVSHQNIQTFLADVPLERQYHLQFEQLVKEPVATMKALSEFLAIPFHAEMLQPYKDSKMRMTDGLHEQSRMLGDVKFHHYQRIEAEVADRWRDKEGDLIISDLSWQVANSLGYQKPTSNILQVDLEAEALLEATIQPTMPYVKRPGMSLLLTGATGFLGAYLLHELLAQSSAKIYCLVRAATIEQGRERLKATLERYNLWQEADGGRLIPLLGDLSLPRLGLSAEVFDLLAHKVDIIYHNGADVNFIYPYSMLKAANVLGTQEILRFACQAKTKPVHFVSTLALFRSAHSEMSIAQEDDEMRDGSRLEGGYAQSKWVAEKLVMQARERGLPVTIYRPGRITGESERGITNTNDLFSRMIKGCLQLGSVPALDMTVDMTPVDYVSRAIVYLSQQEENLNRAFHLLNSRSLHWEALVHAIRSLGYQLEMISYPKWREKLLAQSRQEISDSFGEQEENALKPFLPFFTEEEPYQSRVQISEKNTEQALAKSNITCPPVDRKLLERYFAYFKECGFMA